MITRLARLINRYIKPYWMLLIGIIALQAIATLISLYLPTLNARIIDSGVVKGDIDYIWGTGWVMLGLSAIHAIAQIAAVYLGALTSMKLGRDIRAAVFTQALSFSARELNSFGAPSLLTRSTNDVQQVQMLVYMTCVMLVGAPITMAGGVYMGMSEDIGLSWIIGVSVAVLGIGIGLLILFLGPLFQTMQQRIDDLTRVLREQITGVRVVRAFVREAHEAARFEHTNTDLTRVALRIGRLMAVLFPFVGLVMNLSSVGVMWFGAGRVSSGDIMIGQLTAFISYLMQILIAVMMTTLLFVMVPRAAVSADRILEILDTSSSVVPPERPAAPLRTGIVEFCDVEFSYPGAESPVLHNINLILHPGRTTAIIGSTGSGKSTLINLIPRLFDVTSGVVKVDGVDVRDLDPDVLWARIGLVPQKPYLFSGTIASNLRYGNADATDEELWEALQVAQAADFVAERDGGLDSSITQGGTNVSGGQRQRLSIARALVKKPEIYILDDSFSALDVATDARVRAALGSMTKDATVLIVAQRVSTIVDADEIVVLEDGEIVGRGRHEDLLTSCDTYVEIVESQLSAEEAA